MEQNVLKNATDYFAEVEDFRMEKKCGSTRKSSDNTIFIAEYANREFDCDILING